MEENAGSSGNKRRRIRKKVSKRKLKRVQRWKEATHQLLLAFLIVSAISIAYFLIWGLIIEPNLPRHKYGPGDLKEAIFLFLSILLAAICYFSLMVLKFKPISYEWVNDIRLFISVKFDLDKYAALKRMGIHYRHRKKKSRRHTRSHSNQ